VTISTTHPDTASYPTFTCVPEASEDEVDLELEDDLDMASIISVPRFGEEQGKEFRFNFRHMLHKLYPQDWKAKVQEALEQSKMDYKPLAEKLKDLEKTGSVSTRPSGPKDSERTSVQACRSPGAASKGTRHRSNSTASVMHATPAVLARPVGTSRGQAGELRALKKRCVGRRKSFGEGAQRTNEAGALTGGGWTYDGQASHVEDRGTLKDRRRARRQSLTGPGALLEDPGKSVPSQVELRAGDRRAVGRKRALTTGHPQRPTVVF
jgi:hypothetical protein